MIWNPFPPQRVWWKVLDHPLFWNTFIRGLLWRLNTCPLQENSLESALAFLLYTFDPFGNRGLVERLSKKSVYLIPSHGCQIEISRLSIEVIHIQVIIDHDYCMRFKILWMKLDSSIFRLSPRWSSCAISLTGPDLS